MSEEIRPCYELKREGLFTVDVSTVGGEKMPWTICHPGRLFDSMQAELEEVFNGPDHAKWAERGSKIQELRSALVARLAALPADALETDEEFLKINQERERLDQSEDCVFIKQFEDNLGQKLKRDLFQLSADPGQLRGILAQFPDSLDQLLNLRQWAITTMVTFLSDRAAREQEESLKKKAPRPPRKKVARRKTAIASG